jgi:hypothetical protein
MEAAGTVAPQGKHITFRVLVWVFAAGSLFGLFGFAFITAWFDSSDGGIHRVHYMGFGALFGIILTTALVVQNWHPENKISAFYQMLDVGLALFLAGLLATDAGGIIGGLVVLVAYGILFALHPARRLLTHPPREGFSLVMLAMTLVGAVPLIWFAVSSASLQRNGSPIDPHVKSDHWTLMTAMALGILLVALLSSFKFKGWRISAWCAGVSLFFYGLISTVYSSKAGSHGSGWGVTAMIGAAIFVIAAELESRRALA